MEYTIYNESLVKYALRDEISGKYLHNTIMQGPLGVDIESADIYDTRYEAEDARRMVSQEDEKLKGLQIRKIKIIDIGETAI